jgi:uncharacterized repeat protein (TIGR01451 family)
MSWGVWIRAALWGALVFGAGGGAYAAAPPAGTQIGNQAAATFLDVNNQSQESRSNRVATVVAQVGALKLTADNTKSAGPGNTVYMPHTLTNLGNGPDNFTLKAMDGGSTAPILNSIAIYADLGGTGVPSSAPLCGPGSSVLACSSGVRVDVASGASYNFIVAYQVPATAAAGWSGKGEVTAEASSTKVPYDKPSAKNLDTINLAAGAVFAVSKALALPAVNAPGNAAWPAVVTSGYPSPAGSVCSTSWPVTVGSGCLYTVYSINYSNNGVGTGSFAFKDDIPAGMTYVSRSAVWSGRGGVALAEPSTTPAQAVNFTVNGNKLAFSVPGVQPNASGSVSFVVLVNSLASTDSANTGNVANYGNSDCIFTDIDNCATTPTNRPPFTVKQVFAPVAASVSGWMKPDLSSDLPANNADNNLVVVAAAAQNSWVSFTNYVTNAGNGVDSFNLSMFTGAGTNFPGGTVFRFYKADGQTPLLDTNGDNLPDTGPMTPGESTAIVVKALLPANAPVGRGPYSARMDALSAGSVGTSGGVKIDSVWDQLTQVTTLSVVDLTNTAEGSSDASRGDLGAGPSAQPTTTVLATPGKPAGLRLFVKNNDSSLVSYQFAHSSSASFPGSLPTGWTVRYYASGTTCKSTDMPAELAQPFGVAAGAQADFVACVTPPSDSVTLKTTQSIYFEVKSISGTSSGATVSDVKYDAVLLSPEFKKLLALEPNLAGQVAPGGTVTYFHTITNKSTGGQSQACGPLTVTATGSSGWSYTLMAGPAGAEVALSNGQIPAIAAGQSLSLKVTLLAPSNAADKFIDKLTLTVTDSSTSACGEASALDTTTVSIGNQLALLKEQALDADCTGVPGAFGVGTLDVKPGACVVYRITATNTGQANITKVWLADSIPNFTSFSPNQPGNPCVASGNATGGSVQFVHAEGSRSLSCGSDAIVLPGSGTGTVTMQFGVRLDTN